MTLMAPHCTCSGPLAAMFGDGSRCAVHGTRETRKALENAQAGREALRRELDGVTEALRLLIESVERDRREPDKILCHLASARRRLFDAQTPAFAEKQEDR